MKVYRLLNSLLIVSVLALLGSCGSSTSSSDGTGNIADPTTSAPGRVSLLITDGPRTDFDQILVTLESIRFLSEDGNGGETEQIIFDEPRVINLLALQSYSDLLVTTELPAGSYDKIRLYVSKVELVKLNDDGTVAESHLADLPANGKIDLNPRGSFDVVSNGHLIVELDMDANKSFLVVKAGNKDKYKFRPVVFINVLGEQEIKLVLLDGKVFDKTDSGLVLCDSVLTEVDDSCLDVALNSNTVVQDDAINTIPAGDLVDGDIVKLLGKMSDTITALHIVKNNDTDTTRDLFSGRATSTVDIAGMFSMDTNDANPLVPAMTSLDVTMADGARIFNKFGNVLSADAVSVGGSVNVYGLAIPDLPTITDVTAAFVLYNEIEAQDHLTGSIVASDLGLQQLTVNGTLEGDISSGDYCVSTSGADIYLLTSTPDGITSEIIAQDALVPGQQVDVYANGLVDGCYQTDLILVSE